MDEEGERAIVSMVKISRIADEVRRLLQDDYTVRYTLDDIPTKLQSLPDGDYLKFLGEFDADTLENGDVLKY
jgi:hypothetical protein